MLAVERRREILSRLQSGGAVRVSDLARELLVTPETVRRDLDRLGREGLLQRTHGGAVAPGDEDAFRELPFGERRTAHHDLKVSIARRAVEHIAPGDVIALDASSTAHEVARLLRDEPITVVTNALPATIALLQRPRVRVISTGGRLDAPSLSWVGSFAEETFRRLHVQKLFLSTKGVELERGLSEADDAQASLKRRMLEAADEVCLLADHTKLGVKSVVFFAELGEVDEVITDAGADEDMLARLREMGIRTETAG